MNNPPPAPASRFKFTEDELQQFIASWKKEFDEELTLDQAREEMNRLLELYWGLAHWLSNRLDRHDN